MIENIVSKMIDNNEAERTHLNRFTILLGKIADALISWNQFFGELIQLHNLARIGKYDAIVMLETSRELLDLFIQFGEAEIDFGNDLLKEKAVLEEIITMLDGISEEQDA